MNFSFVKRKNDGFSISQEYKVIPGLKVNLSHKGITSATIGKPGASVNIRHTNQYRYSWNRSFLLQSSTLHKETQYPTAIHAATTSIRSSEHNTIKIKHLALGGFGDVLFYCRGDLFLVIIIFAIKLFNDWI